MPAKNILQTQPTPAKKGRRKSLPGVAVVGLGYVGLPLAVAAAERGYHIIGVDRDVEKVLAIRAREMPFVDEELGKRLKALPAESLDVTDDYSYIVTAELVIFCVPTPVHENHLPNLEPLEQAIIAAAPHLKRGVTVIVESTINPGVCEEVVLPLLQEYSGLVAGESLFLAHCPERINPGDKEWRLENIPRVLGGLDMKSLSRAYKFYRSIINAPIHLLSSLAEAEAVKVVENSFRDINIAFVNELAMSFSRLGIDVVNVIRAASTKPFAFLPHYPGCGVGGHCIPVDPYYLIECGRQNGFSHQFLSLARAINNQMPRYTVDRLVEVLADKGIELAGSRVAVLGLAYKADIDDVRESPSFDIIREISRRGGIPVAFDPYVPEKSDAKSLAEALEGAKAAVVATAHRAFKRLKPQYFLERGVEVVIDGCNCLSKERYASSLLVYRGIGR